MTGAVFAGGYLSGEQAGKSLEAAILDLCAQVSKLQVRSRAPGRAGSGAQASAWATPTRQHSTLGLQPCVLAAEPRVMLN